MVGEASRHLDSPRLQVDLLDARSHEREQQAGVELERVVGRARVQRGHTAERASPLLLDLEAQYRPLRDEILADKKLGLTLVSVKLVPEGKN